jgi:hypothetical protein
MLLRAEVAKIGSALFNLILDDLIRVADKI